MRWEDEEYVRVYKNDTPDWLALGWEARALFHETLKKVDRAGLLNLGRSGLRGLSALTGIPIEVVERAMPLLLEDGCVIIRGSILVMPNYIQAQTATKSDKQRQRECRARARDAAMAAGHNDKQSVTSGHEHVTPSDTVDEVGHAQSRPGSETAGDVTLCSSSSYSVAEDSLPPRAIHGAGTTEPEVQPETIKPSGFDWLTYYNARFFQKRGKQRGASSDAKATSDLHDKLKAISAGERADDWARREAIVDEFLARSDRSTVEAGHMFAFFVTAFDGLRIPKEKRPKPDQRNGKPSQQQARY